MHRQAPEAFIKNTSPLPVASLALLLASILWASAFIVMKWALGHFHPLSMIALRMLVAGLCFVLLIPRLRRGVAIKKEDAKWFLLMALAEPCLYFVFETYAISYTTASQAGAISAVLPLMVAVGAVLFLKENMPVQGWLGAFMAIAGVIWLSVVAQATQTAPAPLLGNFLEFCAMAFAAVYSLCGRRLAKTYPPLLITAVQAWIGAIFFLPALFIPGMGLPESAPPMAWAAILYLGAVVSLVAFSMFNFGLSRLKAGSATIYLNLIPVFALIMGAIFLGERLTPQQYPACVLVLLGLVISQKPGKKARPPENALVNK